MKKTLAYVGKHGRSALLLLSALVLLSGLLLYHLGSLTGGLSSSEQQAANALVGWHGLYHHPLYLPLNLVRSIDFYLFRDHGQTLTRLPNIFFGALAVIAFAWLIKLWHNTRTAILATLLFATSAWVLHVSRLASFDVLYLWAMPTLLLMYMGMVRGTERATIFYGSALLWSLMLYIPGLIWLVLLEVFWLRHEIADGWQHFNRTWHRALYVVSYLVWLPLLVYNLRRISDLRTWLGLPAHFATFPILVKQFVAVFVHIFVRGPQYPQLWLGRIPLLDVFTLAACLLGVYFYATHLDSERSRMLLSLFGLGTVLIALGGPVSLSLVVPLAFVVAATGIAYLVHKWLRTFPLNPLARTFGLGLIIVAVALSCLYNLRAYFIAWPHNTDTKAIFRYHR